MNEESNLRLYTNMLTRHWRLIVAATLLAGAAALAVGLASPVKFEATATVLVASPPSEFRLSADGQNAASSQPPLAGKAAVDLAINDSLLEQVLARTGQELPADQRNLFSLRKILKAKTGADASVVNLSAATEDAKTAALIANTWATLYSEQVNALYGKPQDQSTFYAEQLTQAESEMKRADQALVDFEKRSELGFLQAQLSAKQKSLSNYLGMSESLVLLERDVTDLQEQLSRRPANSSSSLGDDLTQLILQVSVLSTPSSQLPLQFQVPSTGSLSNWPLDQQSAYLSDLARTIESKRTDAKKQIDTLAPEIKALQGRMQETSAESTRLTRERDLAQNVYAALALKAREARIVAQSESGSVRLVSSAARPERPVSRHLLANTLLALITGLLIGAGAAFAREYFRGSAEIPAGARPERSATLSRPTE